MLTALGLMSGTSMDGVDAAIIRTNGERIELTPHWLSKPYTTELRARIRETLGGKSAHIAEVEKELTLAHAEIVADLLAQADMKPWHIDVIGFHGQTILHRPQEGISWQIGDGKLLAHLTEINVVNDFRIHDVRAGGQGAPLVPLFHEAIAKNHAKPLAILNIGGVANVTYISNKGLLAFDTGPGVALLDDWMLSKTGQRFDESGHASLRGIVQEDILEDLLADPFFDELPPKSLDRNRFIQRFISKVMPELTLEEGAATLAAFTAASVVAGCQFMPEVPKVWYVTGGGRYNQRIMMELQYRLNVPVFPIEALKVDDLPLNGDSLEAQAFAFLAVRSLKKLPLSLPTTTGVSRSVTGGVFYQASRAGVA